ncbi:hypothetical protein LLEC1_03640 [Akanthomyces lecanii]|uniref:F-box domain-containing protein n=1 Tax=Cordyceps confragosa TaxID=2714763 RepID=A0A179HYK6_CORDF|nr:hypothetical protein LLEC1_03640 [Akanthomyces lecanii]
MAHNASLVPCLLCGRMVFDGQVRNTPTWLNQFRILYSDVGVVSITGVSYFKDATFDPWIAPPDYNARWDDDGSDDDAYNALDYPRIGVLRQSPRDGRWGFPCHEACWSLLEVALAPQPVPLERLFDLCKSFPIPESQFCPEWGHYYGGLNRGHSDDGRCVEVSGIFTEHHRLCVTEVTKCNPFNVPEIQNLRINAVEDIPQVSILRAPFFDPFASLPQELLVNIAALLPTRDFFNLRLASQFFVPVFYQQNFWSTRFGPGSERCWVFETQRWERALDWRRLHRRTSLVHRSQAMHNRERVWLLAMYVKRLLEPEFVIAADPITPLLTDPHLWRKVSVDVYGWDAEDPYGLFRSGCVELHYSPKISLPQSIDRISFFLHEIGEVEYVVGLRVIGTCGAVVELGYMAREIVVDVSRKSLAGLCVALVPTGIRAVRCVFGDGSYSPWVGSEDDAAQTRKLVAASRLSAISAQFDGCRIVSLGVAAEEWAPGSLRDTAVWEKGVPDPALRLNEAFFSTMYVWADNGIYDSIHRSVFGGTRGQSLRYLTGIQVYMTSTPCGLEFEFTPGHLDYVDTCEDLGVFPDSEMASLQHFSINGPGGERISGVELYVYYRPNETLVDGEPSAELDSFKAGFFCRADCGQVLTLGLGFYESRSVPSLSI